MQLSPRSPHGGTCRTCRHMLWSVGLGLGARCAHPANRYRSLRPGAPAALCGATPVIPGRGFSCPHHEDLPAVEAG